jgi:hypothetical protein
MPTGLGCLDVRFLAIALPLCPLPDRRPRPRECTPVPCAVSNVQNYRSKGATYPPSGPGLRAHRPKAGSGPLCTGGEP